MTDWRGKEAQEDRAFMLHCIKEGDEFIRPTNRQMRRLLRSVKGLQPGQFTTTEQADRWLEREERRLLEQEAEPTVLSTSRLFTAQFDEMMRSLRDVGVSMEKVRVALHTNTTTTTTPPQGRPVTFVRRPA